MGTICALAQSHAVRNFTIDDGLPSNHVYEVKQDRLGFYWISTDNGVGNISLPTMAKGVYVVQLETEIGKLNRKIIL